jgi:hypothetical protein
MSDEETNEGPKGLLKKKKKEKKNPAPPPALAESS